MDSGKPVLGTLYNPREKFGGLMVALKPRGVSVRGVYLQSLEDFTHSASLVFFNMHRVQRSEEDGRSKELPSPGGQFRDNTGVHVHKFFVEPHK